MRFLATITPVGGNLFVVDQVSRPTDPGYGQGHPFPDRPDNSLPGFGHPDNSLPGWSGPVDPGYGRPGYGGGHPGNALPVPPPTGVVTPPIVLPERPHLPAGAGVVVPLPEGVNVPTPTTPQAPGTKPYILWYGPGTQSTVVYLPPSQEAAAPK